MSVNQVQVFLKDIKQFTAESGEFIALEVATGASVKDLHECHPELVPSPLVVNRWRKNVPAFDLLMQEAEEAKAQTLAEEVIGIAKNEERQAAVSGNMIKARQWLAGQLSEGFRQAKHGGGGVVINGDVRLTDAQLMKIASGKFDEKTINGELVEKSTALVGPAVVEDSDESEAVAAEDGEGVAGESDNELSADNRRSGKNSVDGVDTGNEGRIEEVVEGGWDFL